jgi:hypothetical protein
MPVVEQYWQKQAAEPDKSEMENGHSEVREVLFPEPHKADAEQQSVCAVQPPKLIFVDANPLD